MGRLRVVHGEDYFTSVDPGVFQYRNLAARHAGEASTEVGDCRRDYLAGPWRAMPNRKRTRGAGFAGHHWCRESALQKTLPIALLRSARRPGGATPRQPGTLKRRPPPRLGSLRPFQRRGHPDLGRKLAPQNDRLQTSCELRRTRHFSGTPGMITWRNDIDSSAALTSCLANRNA
jgi:hypothetical protein